MFVCSPLRIRNQRRQETIERRPGQQIACEETIVYLVGPRRHRRSSVSSTSLQALASAAAAAVSAWQMLQEGEEGGDKQQHPLLLVSRETGR